ncbi:MAG: cupin domain-containing protein [Planctomycetota bacterium]
MDNLFLNVPDSLPDELVDVLVKSDSVRIERIVSTGQGSPQDFWYDQSEHEWVVVLKGKAMLVFEKDERQLLMGPGDCALIQAHQRHRVAWTSADEPTVWLAVFFV